MKIAGFAPLSLVDYPGQAAAVLFTQGCNLRCPFCHNRALIPLAADGTRMLPWAEVRHRLEARRDLVSAVVVSGGEPTLQKDLLSVLRELRSLGFRIKLDTNGTMPKRLARIIAEGLLDYVALDIKSPLGDCMDGAVGIAHKAPVIRESLDLLGEARIPFEIRTTCHNGIDSQALREIGRALPADASWYLQRCNHTHGYQANFRSPQWAREMLVLLRAMGCNAFLRGW